MAEINLPVTASKNTKPQKGKKDEAPRPSYKDVPYMRGSKWVAIFMLGIGKERGSTLMKQFHQDEVAEISKEMARLGPVDAELVERVFERFSDNVHTGSGLFGSYENTEEYLRSALTPEQVEAVMENIKGPAGRNVWSKITNMSEEHLANYLRNEQPQTIAVVLGNVTSPAHVARVLSHFDNELAIDVVERMLHMEPVSKEVMENLEQTLRVELVSGFGRSKKGDNYALVAEIYNNMDRKREGELTALLGERNKDDMEKVNKLKFVFDDIQRLTREDMLRVMTEINGDGDMKQKLPVALKGAKRPVRDVFMSCMSRRAAGILEEEISGLGPIKVKDAEEAQMEIINLIKEMGKDGEIDLSPSGGDEEMID